jgi:hypothetical protein
MQALMQKTALVLIGVSALAAPSVAKDAPTKGSFEMKIVSDSTANGASDTDGTAFKIQNHHEVIVRADLVFTGTDANDRVAEGYKDASADLHAKTAPLADAADKVRSAGLPSASLMQSIEKCSELEDDGALQACMMKAASGLQGQMQEKCRKDPSLCAAIDFMGDPDTVEDVEAAAGDFQEAMTKFRFYVATSCTVDASVDYKRHDQSASENGGLFRADRSSRTNGFVRGTPSRSAEPCTLEIAVGPDNTMSLAFTLSDTLKFPATHINSPTTQDGDKVKPLSSKAFAKSHKVIKQKSRSPVAFSGEQTFSVPPGTTRISSITTTESAKATVFWSVKLD